MLKRLSARVRAFPKALRLVWNEPSNRGQRLWRTLAFLGWLPTQGFLRPRLIMTLDNGLLVRARTTKLLVNRYESHLTSFVIDNACPGGIMVDVGASIGMYSLQVAPIFDEIICVEPSEKDFTLLRQNLGLNWRQIERFEAHEAAAGEEDGELSLLTATHMNFVPEIDDGSLTEEEIRARGLERTRVPCRSVDSILAGRGPVHFIKIDVEGFEPQVLRGASETIASNPRILVQVEGMGDRQELLDELERLGLRVFTPSIPPTPVSGVEQLGDNRDFFGVGPEHPLAR